jgi:hypothetical protein
MSTPGEFGSSTGKKRGPKPGDGAVVHDSTGEADFDGLPGDVLPPRKDVQKSQPHPPKHEAPERKSKDKE